MAEGLSKANRACSGEQGYELTERHWLFPYVPAIATAG